MHHVMLRVGLAALLIALGYILSPPFANAGDPNTKTGKAAFQNSKLTLAQAVSIALGRNLRLADSIALVGHGPAPAELPRAGLDQVGATTSAACSTGAA